MHEKSNLGVWEGSPDKLTMSIHGKIEQIASGNKIAIGLEL